MSNHTKGYYRDSKILQAIEAHKVLDTEQIHLMFFGDLKYGKRIAQRRLLSLCNRGRLKRGRESIDRPFFYYTDRKGGQIGHKLGVNWVRVWLSVRLKSWESLVRFDYEQDYGTLRTDGFAVIRNKITTKHTFYFIEFDNASSGNPFDKVAKYNTLFERQPSFWWTELTDRFPAVIIVTTGRSKAIMEKVAQENVNGLEFRIYNLDTIRGECNDKA